MIAVMLGLIAAVCWGGADVLARHTGRALGAQGTLLAMTATGMVGLGLWIVLFEHRLPGWPSLWTIGTALLANTAMLMFYEAMRRGPVSLVSPLVGAYPAWLVLINLLQGLWPGWLVLAAMILTMIGMTLVAHHAPHEDEAEATAIPPRRGLVTALAVVSSLVFALTLLVGQQAAIRDGETTMLWWGRVVGILTMALVVISTPRPKNPSPGKVAIACSQGLLDTIGLCALYAAGRGLDGALATVASSAFGVVTIVLARLLYGERITTGQAVGIAAVTGGVVALAGLG